MTEILNNQQPTEKQYPFVHLHAHTEFSLLDGSGKIPEMVARARELGMPALAITDHGTMYGTVEFYKACQREGIRPIIGSEIYVCSGNMEDRTLANNTIHHLVLLVKNETGYQNLMRIVSEASIRGFYYKPRVDHAFLARHSEGLIALSACLGGEVQENLNHGFPEKARAAAIFYRDAFRDGFYLELQDHGLAEQKKVNALNIELARELDIPLVATNDVHYLARDDHRSHDVLLCIQTAAAVDESDRMKYPSPEFYLKSPQQMWELFAHVPEALENTVKIAQQCQFDYQFHVSRLPAFDLPEGTDHARYLKQRCYEGLTRKYPVFAEFRDLPMSEAVMARMDALDSGNSRILIERLAYELGILERMGYVDYFLIVWDFIKFADDHGIATGAGRGSAAASIIAYTLNITKIDPIRYNLIFERFLNPERISMPDIDSDFCYERRQEVIDYVVDKYGKDNVAQIITFGTMAARACIRDVGRAMMYPYGEVDQIAKMIPTVLGITIEKALEMNPELKNAYETDPRVTELINIALRLEGLPRHSSTHAAGVVISGRPLVEYVPLQRNEEAIVTQFPMGTLEELGLLKMDFLGLRTLTVMQDAVTMIRQNRGIQVQVDALPFDDPKVYDMIGEGRTVGVFQLESAGMTSFMKELKPESLEDIIAGISLYRPGPMSEIPRYIESKKNPDQVSYLTPELEHILDVTYGVMVYQEQVMQIVQDLAGYSLGRADLVRRAMSKKKHDVMEQERKNFIEGIVEDGRVIVPGTRRNGISDEAAQKIFDQMSYFASYAFNKAHAAAYAVIGYQTAYLMRYYPVEFIAAMLNSFIGSAEKASFYIRYAKSIGIELLPPDINESGARFTVSGNKIRFGLAGIKNLGFSVIESIIQTREKKGQFTSFHDFMSKLDEAGLNKRACECMIKAGAFDSMGVERSRLLAVYERILESFSSERRRLIKGQMSFFGSEAGDGTEDIDGFAINLPQIEEFPLKDRLFMEKEMTGLYLSGHPLDEYAAELDALCTIFVQDIIANDLLDDVRDEAALQAESQMASDRVLHDGQRVTMGGILTSITRKITRNNAMMAFATLEDPTGEVELIVFPKTYDLLKSFLQEDLVIAVSGRLQVREDENTKVIAEEMSLIEQGKLPQFKMRPDLDRFGASRSQRRTPPAEKPGSRPSAGSRPTNGNSANGSPGNGRSVNEGSAKGERSTSQPVNGQDLASPTASGADRAGVQPGRVRPSKKEGKEGAQGKLYLRFHDLAEARAILAGLSPLLTAHQGSTPVIIYAASEKQSYQLPERQCLDLDTNILELLEKKIGKDNVVLK
ncbi:DNA polymerase III subunit alpha [Proteiniclasticum sp. QWL-01]|uniref:DNA polymerase III subunit alpha n=1 Tax=Proteiniclasticum sp. QWL-01 TaxID=3036945 RepID=UPI002410ECF8|nr:DNA polymerase III subunit alpha [Proteiniclasticum sp. QWL-01]WFF73630.1 DNA polymerase III subunit alpha [Proteiniclasticum sp. QWL-01]